MKLLWAQDHLPAVNDQKVMKQLPRSRMAQNERIHFVLVDSRHSVRYLMLDVENKASFNSSSVLTNVDVSDANMA